MSHWLGATALLLSVGCTADLRPGESAERTQAASEARGRTLLAHAAKVLRDSEAEPWKALGGVRAELSDTFEGLSGWWVRPWPDSPQSLEFSFLPAGDACVARLLGDEPGRVGKHNARTWRQSIGEPAEYSDEPDEELVFWLPTLQYFLELPFRLGEAEIVDYVGEAEVEGELCDRVYATWGSYEPNSQYDQYVAYVSRASGRIVRVDFTVRDFYDFLEEQVVYSDFSPTETGHTLPHTIRIGTDVANDDLLHTIKVARYSVVELGPADYAPAGRP